MCNLFTCCEVAGLNESPSEKEGKYLTRIGTAMNDSSASMKVPPKRKGNGFELVAAGVIFEPQ